MALRKQWPINGGNRKEAPKKSCFGVTKMTDMEKIIDMQGRQEREYLKSIGIDKLMNDFVIGQDKHKEVVSINLEDQPWYKDRNSLIPVEFSVKVDKWYKNQHSKHNDMV